MTKCIFLHFFVFSAPLQPYHLLHTIFMMCQGQRSIIKEFGDPTLIHPLLSLQPFFFPLSPPQTSCLSLHPVSSPHLLTFSLNSFLTFSLSAGFTCSQCTRMSSLSCYETLRPLYGIGVANMLETKYVDIIEVQRTINITQIIAINKWRHFVVTDSCINIHRKSEQSDAADLTFSPLMAIYPVQMDCGNECWRLTFICFCWLKFQSFPQFESVQYSVSF